MQGILNWFIRYYTDPESNPIFFAWMPTAYQYLVLKHAEIAHNSRAQAEHAEIAQYFQIDYDAYRIVR